MRPRVMFILQVGSLSLRAVIRDQGVGTWCSPSLVLAGRSLEALPFAPAPPASPWAGMGIIFLASSLDARADQKSTESGND